MSVFKEAAGANRYPVQMEIAGPLAMFARPDTGSTPTSYPVPTWSAAKGMFEAIAFFADGAAWICPTKVEICRRKQSHSQDSALQQQRGRGNNFQRYTTNYGGPLRKANLFNRGTAPGGSSMQLFATVLSDVCYRLHGEIVGERRTGSVNPRHHLQDLFNRRLQRGQCHRTPFLGWSEFTCSYWGPFRPEQTEVDMALTLEIPSMLFSIWDKPISMVETPAHYAPRYTQGFRHLAGRLAMPLRIVNGVLEYPVPGDWLREAKSNAQ